MFSFLFSQFNFLQGYLVGNPITGLRFDDFNSRIPYGHGVGIISDQLYEVIPYSYVLTKSSDKIMDLVFLFLFLFKGCNGEL